MPIWKCCAFDQKKYIVIILLELTSYLSGSAIRLNELQRTVWLYFTHSISICNASTASTPRLSFLGVIPDICYFSVRLPRTELKIILSSAWLPKLGVHKQLCQHRLHGLSCSISFHIGLNYFRILLCFILYMSLLIIHELGSRGSSPRVVWFFLKVRLVHIKRRNARLFCFIYAFIEITSGRCLGTG